MKATASTFYVLDITSQAWGRFISEDPSEFYGGDVNLYAYVGDDPIEFSDPSAWHASAP